MTQANKIQALMSSQARLSTSNVRKDSCYPPHELSPPHFSSEALHDAHIERLSGQLQALRVARTSPTPQVAMLSCHIVTVHK